MSTYPVTPRSDFIEWCNAQAPVFVTEEAAIGLNKDQTQEFAEAADKARTLVVEQERAQQAALVATRKAAAGLRRLREAAGSTVRSIRAYAETTAMPDAVYSAARISPPAAPTPTPPPEPPTRLSATLDATSGALTLRWKARQGPGIRGTTYLIRRRLPGETGFTFVGSAGKKSFVDESLPRGTPGVEYTVQAQRGQRIGMPSAVLVVNIGVETSKFQKVKTSKWEGVLVGAAE